MKRVFAYIGFSAALTQIVLCLVPITYGGYIKIAAIWLAVIFVASLLLPALRRAEVVPLCAGASLLACLLFLLNFNAAVLPERALDSKTAECTFYVTDDAKNEYSYNAKITSVDLPNAVQNFAVVVKTDGMTYLEPYRKYTALLDFYVKYDDAFKSYGSFSDRVYVNASLNYLKNAGDTVRSPMKYVVYLRKHISNTMVSYLGNYLGGLSVALTTGSKKLLNDSIKSAFTTLGISHLTAVSGLHLSVITGVLLFILKKLRVNKRISSVISLLITLFYMMLADFSGSIVRAGIMLIVILCAEFFGMRGDSLNSLGIAVTVLCLNPYAVCDIGAVLSVTCILAVVVVFPLFNEKLRAKYIDPLNKTKSEILRDGLFNVLSGFYTSVVVGAVTMPVCYVFFGSVSVISAVANIVAIPLGSACVVSSIVFYLLSLLNIPFVSIVAASVTYSLDNALVRCVLFFNSLGNPTFTFDYRYSYVFAAIFILIAVCVLLDNKKLYKLCAALCVLIFSVPSSAFVVVDRNTAYVYVTNEDAGVVRCNNKTVVFGVSNAGEYFAVVNYLNENALSVDVLVSDNDYYSSLICKSVHVSSLICNEFNDTILNDSSKDCLIVNNAVAINLGENSRLYYRNGRVVFELNGFTLGNDSSADVFLYGSKAVDSHGTVLLDRADALYSIKNKNTYSIRRIDNG